VPYILAGLLVVWALSILHAKYATFQLDPYGFLLTFASKSFSEGIWTMVLAAWALKLATLHMGGSKAYEKLGVLVATEFLMEYAISILMDGILSAVRFFISF